MIKLRDCQEEAIIIGHKSKQPNNVIKMFCGSGKTNVMVFTFILLRKSYGVFVFPSIALISQFNSDYVKYFGEYEKLNICSRNEGYDSQFTTETDVIKTFLERKGKKMICVTYQSLHTLVESSNIKPDVVFYDEAHHIFEPRVKDIVFGDYASKQYMFTATPKMNENISLGEPIYSYSHADGVRDGHLNDFQIYVDTSCDSAVYPKIARTILTTENSRVLTFHSDVIKSVSDFVNQAEFSDVFHQVCRKEFPHLVGRYKSIKMIGIDASTTNRRKILSDFDATPDDEIYILASCRTIGEGVDTKKANMCVFVDTKNSYIDIVQNIGRVVRRQPNISTVLLPVSVDKSKYENMSTDEEKDMVIREGLSEGGDFRMILNVLSALRADDPELFDMCLKYPNKFSSDEMKKNFEDQGAELTDEVFEDSFEDHPDVTYEVHTHDMENPVEEHNTGNETVTLYRDEDDRLLVLNTNGKISPPKRKPLIKFHTSEEFKVLWEISNFGDTLCARIESKMSGQELERNALEKAQNIIDFTETHGSTPSQKSLDQTEKKLGIKFSCFKLAKKANKLYPNVDDLFTNAFGSNWWDRDLEQQALTKAREIIDFYNEFNKFPRDCSKDDHEKKLGSKFSSFKIAKKGQHSKINYPSVDELFTRVFGTDWWKNIDLEQQALTKAQEIIEFYKTHNQFPSQTSKDMIENKLGSKFSCFKLAKKANKLYPSVDDLFTNAFGSNWWDRDLEQQALTKAQEIIDFYNTNGRIPVDGSKDKDEHKLGQRFLVFKRTKRGQGKHINYTSVDELFTSVFGVEWWVIKDKEQQALDVAQEIVDFYMKYGTKPRTVSKDEYEMKLGQKFSCFKKAKNGDDGIDYSSVDKLFTKAFGSDWWITDLGHKALKQAQEIVDFHKIHGKFPVIKSNDPNEKKLGQKFSDFKKAKKGQCSKINYPSVDELFTKSFGADWFVHKKCAHKWKVVDEDEHFHFTKCEKCGRKSRKNRNSSDGRYHEPNPDKKKEINNWFGGIDYIPGKAVILDAENMNTTNGLYNSKSFTVEQMVIPEYDTETYEKNSKDPIFGKCVKNGDFLEILKGENPSDLSLIYADFTGTFHKWIEPLFSYLETSSIKSGVILGITWSVNGHKTDLYTNITKIGVFCGKNNWEEIENSPSEYGYGVGGNMFVKFLRKL